MERYSEYKDSGVKWLGDIPSHWEVMPLKNFIKFEKGKTPKEFSDENIGLPYLTMDYLRSRDNKIVKYPIASVGLFEIEESEALVLWDGANAGEFILSKKGYLGSTMAKISGYREYFNNLYFYYFLKMLEPTSKDFANGTTIPHFDASILINYHYPIPPIDEQIVIGSYLDAATSKIDKAIAMQQKMIDLLNERKQIIIQNAVTKGLDENVEMKDSGVEWIGMIPKHWEISKLKYLIDAPLKYGANEASDLIDYSCPRYIRITDIDANGKLKEETYRSLPMSKAESYLLKKGDLLFARSGATVGKAFLFEEDYAACYAGYLIKAHMDQHKVLPKFVYLYTQTFAYQHWKESIFIQATIQNISGEKYANMQIAIPTIEEQNNIIDMLTPKMQRFDSAISNCQRQITLLQERKQIIINELVTGKVKVS